MTIPFPTRSDRASERVIEVESVGVRYGDFEAVKDLSFNVERGELYALLGTNGAGKTSALEVIEGHRPASAGTVRVFGRRPTDAWNVGVPLDDALPLLAVTLAWVLVAVVLATRLFRWEPR